MPNTGKPSKDCHLCRRRRVKCDLARPGCQRCVKYGVQCPGYREQNDLIFRNAGLSTSKRSKKKVAPKDDELSGTKSSSGSDESRSNTPAGGISDLTTTIDGQLAQPLSDYDISASLAPLSRPLAEHWTRNSIPILLNAFPVLEFLNDLYRMNHSPDSPLLWAAHLFSRTYITNIRHPVSVCQGSETETRSELGTYLGKTLSAVSVALNSPDGAFRDDIVATVWILSNYELLIGSIVRLDVQHSSWILHVQGLGSILKARGSSILLTPQGRRVFWPCYNMMQVHMMVTNSEFPPESAEWLQVMGKTLYPGEALSYHVSRFIRECMGLVSRIALLLNRNDYVGAAEQYEYITGNFDAAEREMNDFLATMPRLTHARDALMANFFHTGIIKGNIFIMMLANFLTHYAPSNISVERLRIRYEHCKRMIRHSGQCIINSIPTVMGHLMVGNDDSPRAIFDAMKMIWPLTCISIAGATYPEHKSEARATLLFIGKKLGIRQALRPHPPNPPRYSFPDESQQPLGYVFGDDVAPPFVNLDAIS